MRGRKVGSLKHKNYDVSDAEWSAVLRYFLVSKQGSGVSETIRSKLEVSCPITGKDPKATLSIQFRTRVEDITQRLGTVELTQTPDTDDVDLFGWTSQAIEQRDRFEDQIVSEKRDAGKSDETITTLKTQLEELVRAKEEHENDLLSKFAALLNEKKLRLREVERILSTGKLDQRALDHLEKTLPPAEAQATRGQKRSARQAKQTSESDESDGFEDMEIDKAVNPDSDDGRQTADRGSDTETDNDLDQPITSQTETGSAGPSKPSRKAQDDRSLPPRRDLPFTKAAEKKAEEPVANDDEETESEDDEL